MMSLSGWRSVGLCGVFSCVVAGVVSWPGASREDAQEGFEQQPLGALNILTRGNNADRTGANLSETVLNTSNVKTSTFGKVSELAVDDQIYAGLLYASNVSIGGVTHNVIYASTVNNSVY